MIDKKVYDKLKEGYKDVASWAVWSPVDEGEKARPTSNTGDMTVFDKPDLLNVIHNDYVLVALNASVHADRKDGFTGPWRMFHSDDNRRQKDFKLRYAVVDTPLEGAYMTDVIKNHPNKNSGQVVAYCKENPQTIVDNIKVLKEELEILGGKPVLVGMGQAVYDYLSESSLKDDYEIVMINHYSYTAVTKDMLREQVLKLAK